MGACNSNGKAPADPSAELGIDSCPQMLPQVQPGKDAPVLLSDPGAEKTPIKAVTAAEVYGAAGSPTSLLPCSPSEGPRSMAPSPDRDCASEHTEATTTAVATSSPTPKEAFEAALAWVKCPDNALQGVPNERKLNLYKFYKQATEGDVRGAQPWAAQLEARAKWDAWRAAKGMSSEDAMKCYVEELEAQKEDFGGK